MKYRSTAAAKMRHSLIRYSFGARIMLLTQRKNRCFLFLLGLISLFGLSLVLKVNPANLHWMVMTWILIFAVSSVLFDLGDQKKVSRRLKRDFFTYIGWKIIIRNETAATILFLLLTLICSWRTVTFLSLLLASYAILWVSDEMEKF